MGLGVSQVLSLSFINRMDTIPTHYGYYDIKWDKINKMPGYGQFSINVSFPTFFSQYRLTFPFFSFYCSFFFLELRVNFIYIWPKEICQDKMEIEAGGQVALTLSNPTFKGMKTLRPKQQIMPFEINFVLWLCLS